MAITVTSPPEITSRRASRTSHFVLPRQWASMRKAEALQRETGKRVVHFEKGDFQGDEFRPAPHIDEACKKAIKDGHVRYVPGPGLPELRDAIAEETSRRGRPTARDEVLVTMGAKHALTQCLLTLIDPGDEVIFPNPGYPPDEFWGSSSRPPTASRSSGSTPGPCRRLARPPLRTWPAGRSAWHRAAATASVRTA